eukprot:2244464-Prymnesium_polylepis.2
MARRCLISRIEHAPRARVQPQHADGNERDDETAVTARRSDHEKVDRAPPEGTRQMKAQPLEKVGGGAAVDAACRQRDDEGVGLRAHLPY